MKSVTVNTLLQMKQAQEKIACLTAYDASFSQCFADLGVEVILVGDTLGCVIQGHDTTIPVTLDEVCYHLRCVSRAKSSALIIGDLPFMTYARPEQALESASALMQAGAEIIKLEGGRWLAETIIQLTERGIPVCGHLGLTPQSVHQFGGYKIQGRDTDQAARLIEDAKRLQEAGCCLLVLECIPAVLAKEITEILTIPTIGIGAGVDCDGQVLVLYDILGLTPEPLPRFCKVFLNQQTGSIQAAIAAYVHAVKAKEYPEEQHGYRL